MINESFFGWIITYQLSAFSYFSEENPFIFFQHEFGNTTKIFEPKHFGKYFSNDLTISLSKFESVFHNVENFLFSRLKRRTTIFIGF